MTEEIDITTRSTPVECKPITTIEDLFLAAANPPSWFDRTLKRRPRSKYVIENDDFNCHINFPGYFSGIPRRLDRASVPKTLVCHDMKNGYLEDKFCDLVNVGNGYTFTHWCLIDAFVYFSHHFITIPPLQWINVAHANGVQMLGTIITEWQPGETLCNAFLQDEDALEQFVKALKAVTVACKLDGWLINIENKIAANKIGLLVKFVEKLTLAVHSAVEDGLVIWYDSVISTGELKWQNELNSLNSCFFDVCDGIFLNYTMTQENLKTSFANAPNRNLDVYVGIDVFGRNTPYPAGHECYLGLQMARDLNLSVAIFAPGWTHEGLNSSPVETFFARFANNDHTFWKTLFKYLYTHPITHSFHSSFQMGTSEDKYFLPLQEQQLTHPGCCFKSYVHTGRCYYEGHKDAEKTGTETWHHLFAADFYVEGAYAVILETLRRRCKRHEVVLVFVIQQLDGTVAYTASRPRTFSKDCRQSRLLVNTKQYFLTNFPEKAKLMHIYAKLPFVSLILKTFSITAMPKALVDAS